MFFLLLCDINRDNAGEACTVRVPGTCCTVPYFRILEEIISYIGILNKNRYNSCVKKFKQVLSFKNLKLTLFISIKMQSKTGVINEGKFADPLTYQELYKLVRKVYRQQTGIRQQAITNGF